MKQQCTSVLSALVALLVSVMMINIIEAKTRHVRQVRQLPAHITQPATAPPRCLVDSLPTQQFLDLNRVQGYWYGAYTNRLWTDTPALLQRFPHTQQADFQMHLRLAVNDSLEVKLSTSVGKAVCIYLDEKGQFLDKYYYPHEFELQFKNWMLNTGKTSTFVILATDYDGYLVLYTCKRVLYNGGCAPEETFFLSLTRRMNSITPAALRTVNDIAQSVCVSSSSLWVVKQDGTCRFNADKFPKTQFGSGIAPVQKNVLQQASSFMSMLWNNLG